MAIGRFYGIIAVILGGILSYIGYGMLTETGSVFKILLAAPAFFCMGIAMIFLPGAPVTLKQTKNKEAAPRAFIDEAPKLHRIAWLAAGAVGFITAMIMIRI